MENAVTVCCEILHSSRHLVGPVSLLVVQVAKVRVEASPVRGVVIFVAAQVPFPNHVTDEAVVVQVLRKNLDKRKKHQRGKNNPTRCCCNSPPMK